MATQVQWRRGTTAEHSTFAGAEGEITVDTTKDTLVVHDGVTQGGKPLSTEDTTIHVPGTGLPNEASATLTSFDNAETGYSATNVQQAIDETFSLIGSIDDVVTVEWDMVNDTYSGNFKANEVHKNMRRCVVNEAGEVVYYLDEFNSALKENGTAADLTGADGNVMVEIPKTYVRFDFSGNVLSISMTFRPVAGFVLHPAFSLGNHDFIYKNAYDPCVYDVSSSTFIDGLNLTDNRSRVDVANDKLASVSGRFPMVGLTRNEFRTLASNNTGEYSQELFWERQLLQVLFVTEYGNFNSQAVLGNGNTERSYPASSANQADSPHVAAGESNFLGNQSGGRNDSAGVPFVSYRGIENLYGNCWNFLDGINILDRQLYVTHLLNALADNTETGYQAIGNPYPVASASFIKDWQPNNQQALLVNSVGGGASSSTFVGDALWTNAGWRVARVGGSADSGGRAGVSAATLNRDSGSRLRGDGGSLTLRK